MGSLSGAFTMRRIKCLVVRLAVLGGVAVVLGFVGFIWLLPKKQVVLKRDADGIVALTGGTARVSEALDLLASGRGKRLLITGVNPETTAGAIARQVASYRRLFACCVDLDHSALNTFGNAVGARRWAAEHGFHSLIIVTSAYHMPRALAEISHQLPHVTLIPFPVVSDRMRIEPWWSSGARARLVLSEYLKFLFAKVRMRFDAVTADGANARFSDARPAGAPR